MCMNYQPIYKGCLAFSNTITFFISTLFIVVTQYHKTPVMYKGKCTKYPPPIFKHINTMYISQGDIRLSSYFV